MPGGIQPPIEVFLSWPQPNLVDPEMKPNTITMVAYVFGPLTVTLFLIRLWVRIFHQRNPGWDDWVMLAAMVRNSILWYEVTELTPQIPTIASTVLVPIGTSPLRVFSHYY
jgi:predicted permease